MVKRFHRKELVVAVMMPKLAPETQASLYGDALDYFTWIDPSRSEDNDDHRVQPGEVVRCSWRSI